MRILNLYSGIGGNRKLWGYDHEITAIEYEPKIAEAYQRIFPKDRVIVTDAHQYLLGHYHEFDFIWSSPPCQSHTTMNKANSLSPYKDNSKQIKNGGGIKVRYPDMTLYQEIILLTHHFKGKWCVENVVAYYEPLIKPQVFGNHWFWTNILMPDLLTSKRGMGNNESIKGHLERKGFTDVQLKGLDKRLVLRNCVEPEVGRHILDYVVTPYEINYKLL